MWKSLSTIKQENVHTLYWFGLVLMYVRMWVSQNTTVVSYTKCLIIFIVSKEEKCTTDLYMFNKTSYKINKYAEQLHWHWSVFSPKGYKTSPKVNCSCTNQAQWYTDVRPSSFHFYPKHPADCNFVHQSRPPMQLCPLWKVQEKHEHLPSSSNIFQSNICYASSGSRIPATHFHLTINSPSLEPPSTILDLLPEPM